MKTYLKLLVAGVSIFAASVYAVEDADTTTTTTETATESDDLSTVESATAAIVASVALDDKEKTLALLAAACEKFPNSAAAFVKALIEAISAANANSTIISATNVALGGNPGDVNPAVVVDIVATAVNAAGAFRDPIIAAAKLAAPNVSALDLSGATPLSNGQNGLGGLDYNSSTLLNAIPRAS